jgi:DNA mismatch repair protein MutS
MAQAGLFVPADCFTFSVYKSIYTRILGNDNLFKGLSTFAVEMTELRSILKNANENSLILGDELCSGTESTSALSIFTAGIKYLSNKNCSFIFATHFHEIINYSEIKEINTLKLLHMSVLYDRVNDRLIYDRKLKEGPGDNMYGLEVCKSLNLPEDFLDMAHDIRNKYNNKSNVFNQNGLIIEKKTSQYNSSKIKGVCEICKESEGTEVHHLIYQKEFENGNSKGNKLKKNHKANLINICEKCHDKIHEENSQLKIYKTTNGYEIL